MTDMAGAIAAHYAHKQQEADARASVFEPDDEMERLAVRMDEWRETDPRGFEDANLGDLRNRVMTYQRRKAMHEQRSNR